MKNKKKERGKGKSVEATGTSKKLPELQPEKLTYRQLRQLKKRDLLQILLESEEELEFVKQQLQMERDLRAQYMCEPRSYQQAIHQQEDNAIVQPVNSKIESHEKQVRLPSEPEENISDILSKMMNSKSSKRSKREKKSK